MSAIEIVEAMEAMDLEEAVQEEETVEETVQEEETVEEAVQEETVEEAVQEENVEEMSLEDARRHWREMRKTLKKNQENQEKLENRILKIQERLEKPGRRPSARRTDERRLQENQEEQTVLVQAEANLCEEMDRMEEQIRRLAVIREAEKKRERALARRKPAPVPYQIPGSASETVMVRMLSGDILPVLVDFRQPVREFAKEFAGQHGYNPRVIGRFTFVIQSESESDEKGEEKGEEKEEKVETLGETGTWSERFPSLEIPLLHLLIQPEAEPINNERFELLEREVLARQNRQCLLSQEETMSQFNLWYLTYALPPNFNRYVALSDFVSDHPDLFPPITEEEMASVGASYDALKKELGDAREKWSGAHANYVIVENLIRVRREDLVERRIRREWMEQDPEFVQRREEVRQQYLAQREEHGGHGWFLDWRDGGVLRDAMTRHFSILELAEMNFMSPMRRLMNEHWEHYECTDLYVPDPHYPTIIAEYHLQLLEGGGEDYLPMLELYFVEVEAKRNETRAEVERISPLLAEIKKAHPAVIQAYRARLRREEQEKST